MDLKKRCTYTAKIHLRFLSVQGCRNSTSRRGVLRAATTTPLWARRTVTCWSKNLQQSNKNSRGHGAVQTLRELAPTPLNSLLSAFIQNCKVMTQELKTESLNSVPLLTTERREILNQALNVALFCQIVQ